MSLQKNGSGTANAFTLKINYDPFNHGQNTTDKIEALDSLIADMTSYDIDEDNQGKFRGYLQYGYNYTEDQNMISPKYELIISKANSSVDWSSGITVYTFEGVSYLAPSCRKKICLRVLCGEKSAHNHHRAFPVLKKSRQSIRYSSIILVKIGGVNGLLDIKRMLRCKTRLISIGAKNFFYRLTGRVN